MPDEETYSPVDPRGFRSTSPGPALSDAPHSPGATIGEDAETADPADPGVIEEPLPQFDPAYMQEFDGLLFIGSLSKTFTWMGHTIKIRTITQGETLEVALLQRPYVGSLGEIRAYQSALVAACCMEVDGRPMPLPITTVPSDTMLRTRFEYINNNWFPPLIDVIYEQYLLLEMTVNRILEEMRKAAPFDQTV